MIMIRQFEQISLNAWPALQTIFYDGWILRFANGVTRRANSIIPLFESNLDIGEKIATCEDIYREHNLPAMYKMTVSVSPLNLDRMFDIVVMAEFRNKGFGRMIVESLLDWGRRYRATTAYLQVFANNLPALSLYRKMGFHEKYKYWYREKKQ